jgi:phage tail-like protein
MKRTYLWPVIILCAGVLISLTLVADSRLCGQNADIAALSAEPSDSFVFQLELGGQVVAEYTECFGLGSSNEIEEAVIQTNAGAVKQKTPGALEWHNITLKRIGPSSDQVWSSWRKAMEDGKPDEATRNGAIIMSKSGSSEPLARWNLTHAWPASLTIQGSAEELTIVHQGLERVGASSDGRRDPNLR